MNWHHKIKPHHHVTIWIAAASLVVASGIFYNSALVNKTLAEQGQPSAATQKFFGFNDQQKEQDFSIPDVCKQPQQQMQELAQQLQANVQAMQQLQNQAGQPTASVSATLSTYQQQQLQQLQQKQTSLQAQMTALTQQLQAGPSDDCKKAMIAESLTRMEDMQGKMEKENRFFGTLTKVDQAIAKVQADIPALQAAGVPTNSIDKINTDIVTVKAQEAILTSFFNKMKAFMDNWIAQAKSNPLKAYDAMRSGSQMQPADASTAANAADKMVSSFNDLVDVLDSLSGGSK